MAKHLRLSEYDTAPFGGNGLNIAAVPVGRYKGKRFYRFPVYTRYNSSRLCGTIATSWNTVVARTAAEAANYFADRCGRPETEFIAIGPKGGEVLRYVGWHTAIGKELCAARGPVQGTLL